MSVVRVRESVASGMMSVSDRSSSYRCDGHPAHEHVIVGAQTRRPTHTGSSD